MPADNPNDWSYKHCHRFEEMPPSLQPGGVRYVSAEEGVLVIPSGQLRTMTGPLRLAEGATLRLDGGASLRLLN